MVFCFDMCNVYDIDVYTYKYKVKHNIQLVLDSNVWLLSPSPLHLHVVNMQSPHCTLVVITHRHHVYVVNGSPVMSHHHTMSVVSLPSPHISLSVSLKRFSPTRLHQHTPTLTHLHTRALYCICSTLCNGAN